MLSKLSIGLMLNSGFDLMSQPEVWLPPTRVSRWARVSVDLSWLQESRCWGQAPGMAFVRQEREVRPGLRRRPTLPHIFDQTVRPHVRPVGVDVIEASTSRFRAKNVIPTGRNCGKLGPQRMLSFVVHEYQERAFIIVEWICHCGSSRWWLRCA
jgi:hypothetical protein